MLLYFKVSNSRSFDEEVEFSMIASDYGDLLPENTYYLKKYNIHVLKSAVIYGANASGKSNLLTAISDACIIIFEGYDKNTDVKSPYFFPNRNDERNHFLPTSYIFGFVINEICYEYSFSCDNERIYEEKLVEMQPDFPIIHYHRIFDKGLQKYYWADFSDIFKDRGESIKMFTKSHRLFLSVAYELSEEAEIPLASNICSWFRSLAGNNYVKNMKSEVVNKVKSDNMFNLLKDQDRKDWFLHSLTQIDFLIKDIAIQEVENINKEKENIALTYHEVIDKKGIKQIIPFNLSEESEGTKDLIEWLGVFHRVIATNQILILDEFHNSLHLHLTEYLIKFFHRESKQAQLIFATHDVKLMQSKLFRPDQIWLVKRDKNGNSQLDPLSNYKIDENYALDNMYLEGFYGGIPNIQK